MPCENRFRHQSYPTRPTTAPVVLKLSPQLDAPPDFAQLHSRLGIQRVLLVHGTFAGTDPFGIHAMMQNQVERTSPALQLALMPVVERLKRRVKEFTDTVLDDIANYSEGFRTEFQKLVGDDPLVERLDPTWGSENNHLARAELAMRLLCWLDDCRLDGLEPGRDRVLMWGHSHAGNGFAILSNLLANDRNSLRDFFDTVGDAFGEAGDRARRILESGPSPHPLARSAVFVTFGTPVRYGWDCDGFQQLLHVIHHRPFDAEHPERTVPAIIVGCETDEESSTFQAVQQTVFDVLGARHGDWVQTFAIAGTDFSTSVRKAENERLGLMLETGLGVPTPTELKERFPVLCTRWKTATRLHADGCNLLVEFEPTRMTRFGPAHQSIFGHGVYTRVEWLPAQLALIMDRLQRDIIV